MQSSMTNRSLGLETAHATNSFLIVPDILKSCYNKGKILFIPQEGVLENDFPAEVHALCVPFSEPLNDRS